VRGKIYASGPVTERARALLEAHGEAIGALLLALKDRRTTRQALAQALAPGFSWPGTLDRVPAWPGPEAFVLGVELRRCTACMRYEARRCTRFDADTARANPRGSRCLAFVSRKEAA
jgi:hypothetical protein